MSRQKPGDTFQEATEQVRSLFQAKLMKITYKNFEKKKTFSGKDSEINVVMKEVFPTFSRIAKEDDQKKIERKKPSPIIATRIFLLF